MGVGMSRRSWLIRCSVVDCDVNNPYWYQYDATDTIAQVSLHHLTPLVMFDRESEMSPLVSAWLAGRTVMVRREFATPWGTCDLVGVSFDRERVLHRERLGQFNPISSVTEATILLAVPEQDSAQHTTLRKLERAFGDAIPQSSIVSSVDKLVRDKFLVRFRGDRLQKVNGWMPLQNSLVAVERKLRRIDEALSQAKANLGCAMESFAAFPIDVAERIAERPSQWSQISAGVGVIGVDRQGCKVLVAASPSAEMNRDSVRLYSVDKFWRDRRQFTNN